MHSDCRNEELDRPRKYSPDRTYKQQCDRSVLRLWANRRKRRERGGRSCRRRALLSRVGSSGRGASRGSTSSSICLGWRWVILSRNSQHARKDEHGNNPQVLASSLRGG